MTLTRRSSYQLASNRSVFRSFWVQILTCKGRLSTMDITKLHVFIFCKWMRHLGRTLMFTLVSAIVALATFSTLSSALIPGMKSDNIAAQAGYILLTLIYITVVRHLKNLYESFFFHHRPLFSLQKSLFSLTFFRSSWCSSAT